MIVNTYANQLIKTVFLAEKAALAKAVGKNLK